MPEAPGNKNKPQTSLRVAMLVSGSIILALIITFFGMGHAPQLGAIRVETFSNVTGNQLVGVFDAPDGSTGLDITGINGQVLQLKSDKTTTFGFDLPTNTFTS